MLIGNVNFDYADDLIAYAAFKAISHGIFVLANGGNSGPTPSSVTNNALWIATIYGAGTLDRKFPAHVFLGNGKKV